MLSIEYVLVAVTLVGILASWWANRQHQQSNSHKVFDASFNLIEQQRAENTRLRAIIAGLEHQLKAWRNYAFSLRDQIWRLGADPVLDEPTDSGNNSAEFDKRFADALIGAFDLPSLDRVILTLNRRRENISTAGNKTAVIYDVVELASREGWLSDLKRAARAANPNNEQLKRATS